MNDTHLISAEISTAKWRAETPLSRATLPVDLLPWLTAGGSLTAALMELAEGTFNVELLSQKMALPYVHERQKLDYADGLAAMVREVNLHIHGQPVVFARSIIPLSLAGRGGGGLATLGRTPLGHLLFKDGKMRASRREFSGISVEQGQVYGRRTPYDYRGETILVSEFFLPSLKMYL